MQQEGAAIGWLAAEALVAGMMYVAVKRRSISYLDGKFLMRYVGYAVGVTVVAVLMPSGGLPWIVGAAPAFLAALALLPMMGFVNLRERSICA